jgi:hypothetical protein
MELAIGVLCVSIDNGGFISIDRGAALEEIKWVQGIIPDMVIHGRRLLVLHSLPWIE